MADVNTNIGGKQAKQSLASDLDATKQGAVQTRDPANNDPGTMADQPSTNMPGIDQANQAPVDNREQQAALVHEPKRKDPFLTRHSRRAVSVAELGAALPLIFSSLINQAENIVANEEKEHGSFMLNYFTTSIKALSSIFIYGFRKLVPKPGKVDDVVMNKRPFVFDDALRRTSQQSFVRHITSFIFSMRRTLFQFAPNVFTVPSEQHDPDKPRGAAASKHTKNLFFLGNSVLSPIRFVSSVFSTVVSLPSHLLGALSSYMGDQKSFNFANYGSELSEIMMPVVSNLNSLQRVTKAYFDSWSTNNSKVIELGKYKVGFTNMIQAVFGSFTALPYFFSASVKVKEKLLEKEAGQFKLALLAKDFTSSFSLLLKSLGIHSGSTASLQSASLNSTAKVLEYLDEYSEKYLQKLMNSNGLIKSFFKKFRPTNLEGEVLASVKTKQLEEGITDGYVFNRFKKTTFFSDIYDYLHPLQRTLMLLPNAFVALSDPYVQDNGTRLLRWADRLIGLNSMVLSFPNAVIYFAKTRLPQLILKFYETKQRRKELEGEDYDSYNTFRHFVDRLNESSVPGAGYVAATLQSLKLQSTDFKNPHAIKSKLESLETHAKEQEHALKASELVTAMRIGLRHLIATENSLFFSKRNDDGYTTEEQNKMKIYNAIGNFSTTMRGVPFLGLIVAPVIEMFRNIYKVKKKDNLK
ncbi:MAG: hypothetical protein HOA17_00415, partial [Candidatus Melainabacteria bacterium]|nr:hypothetical protein [Candidatus Melainabacteria bacterium]